MADNISKYGFLRVGAVSPELKVADPDFNIFKIEEAIDLGVSKNCYFLVFPELCLTGYTCGDLFFQQSLLDSSISALLKLKDKTNKNGVTIIVGAPFSVDGVLFNCAVLISQGKIEGIVPKTYLSNSFEYYEKRWFASEFQRQDSNISIDGEEIPFGADLLFNVKNYPNCKVGIELCEDLWALNPPSFMMAASGANIIANLSASSEYLSKKEYRESLIASQSARCYASYIYSASGPNESSTDLVFSGASAIAEFGRILNQTERFKFDTQICFADIDVDKLNLERIRNKIFADSKTDSDFRIIDIEIKQTKSTKVLRTIPKNPFVPFDKSVRSETCEEIFNIQTTGLAKRLLHIGINDVVVGISGGLDSTLTLLIAVNTFNKLGMDLKGIHAVSMPGPGTSDRTKLNAKNLARLFKVGFVEIDITTSINSHLKDIKHSMDKLDTVYENAQARERTQILMDLANKVNGIVIGTGDLSESALGWSTYNGDHMAMYNVNSGVPKTLIKYIIEWAAEEKFNGKITDLLISIFNTPISPELLPANDSGEISQKTEEIIGPYELHDFFLYYFVRCNFSPKKILFLCEQAYKKEYSRTEIKKWLVIFIKRFFENQFKRSCMPDGVKVGSVTLSPRGDWRMPSDAAPDIWLKELEEL